MDFDAARERETGIDSIVLDGPRAQLVRGLGVLVGMLTCSLAAAGEKEDRQGALIAALVVLAVTPLLQFLVAALFPVFTRRVTRALKTEFWPLAGWGALFAVLAVLVGVILAQGGEAGQAAGALVGVLAFVLALAGTTGAAKIIGDWSLARWGIGEMGPLSVLVGAVLFVLAAAVPVVGNIAGLLVLFCGLGAGGLVLLRPQTYDQEAGPEAEERDTGDDPAPGEQFAHEAPTQPEQTGPVTSAADSSAIFPDSERPGEASEKSRDQSGAEDAAASDGQEGRP